MSLKNRAAFSASSISTVFFVACIAIFVQSYVLVKVLFLATFVLTAIVSLALRNVSFVVYPRLISFYVWIAVLGIVWAVVGMLNPGNYAQGNLDAVKLYVIWSAAFVLLYTLLRLQPSLMLVHRALVSAAIVISIMNLVALADQIAGWSLIPESVRQEMELYVGIHEGYVQITSNNIGLMFLIAPYLVSLQFRAQASVNSTLAKMALMLSLVVVVVSGRRALWLIVAMAPVMILVLSRVTGTYSSMTSRARGFLVLYTTAGALALGMLASNPEFADNVGYLTHLKRAFASGDERTVQSGYLLEGFEQSPILGSGFGSYAGYPRSEERPWTYELTYHRLLFNTGVVGTLLMASLVFTYVWFVVKLLARFTEGSAIPFGLLVGLCCLLFGAFTNPYLGSFDYVFFVGLLPYLSTFRQGFDDQSKG